MASKQTSPASLESHSASQGGVTATQQKTNMKDEHAVQRGRCLKCDECVDYDLPSQGNACSYCKCPPVNHQQVPATDLGEIWLKVYLLCYLQLTCLMFLAFLLVTNDYFARQRGTSQLQIWSILRNLCAFRSALGPGFPITSTLSLLRRLLCFDVSFVYLYRGNFKKWLYWFYYSKISQIALKLTLAWEREKNVSFDYTC